MVTSSVAVGLAALIFAYVLFRKYTRPSLSMIRGPMSPSFIFGNLLELYQRPAGETDFAWHSLYGNVIRFKGILGEDHLLVADPKALQKMLNTSAYDYPKPQNLRAISRMLLGRGILWSDGEDHKRHKNIMQPGFGPKEIRALFPIFKECAESLCLKWLEVIGNSNDRSVVVNIYAWLSRGVLDAIGQAAFDVQFGCVQGGSHPIVNGYANFLADIFGLPEEKQIFIQAASKYIPAWLITWITENASNSRIARARYGRNVATNVARELVQEKSDALLQGKDDRDAFTLLVKANMSADAKERLSEDELLAQMQTIILAGHETTGNTVSWILLELARKPKVQSRLRDEIRKTRAIAQARGDPQITVADLEGMTYLNAVIKEGLRFHPALPHAVQRTTSQDDILPLSKPILAQDGKMINEILVPKDTRIIVSIAAYNRDKDLWGEDAHEFNPDRWLDGTMNETKSSAVGVYANLLTFLSGTRACMGWRFAVTEMQTFLGELVGKFEFSMTERADRISRQLGIVMNPMIDGELGNGVELPLAITPAPEDDEL